LWLTEFDNADLRGVNLGSGLIAAKPNFRKVSAMRTTKPLNEAFSKEVEDFYQRTEDGLLYLSHASILVRLNKQNFLFDPVLAKPPHLGSWLFFPEMQIDRRLLEVDAVFVSHQHQDHFDIDFLKLLPKTTPIYIVSGRPQFGSMLEREGISYIELEAESVIDLGNGVNCLGINHEYNGIDAAITISNGNFTAYHGNDCFVSNEKLKIVKAKYPVINVACIPFAYVHWYPFLLEEVAEEWKQQEADRLITEYLNYGLQQIEFLRPQIAIPFGANMFYCDDINSQHNKAVLSPFDFKEYAKQKRFEFESSIFPLFSGDKVFSVKGIGEPELEVAQKPFSLEDLHAGFKKYLAWVQVAGTGFDSASIESLSNEEISDFSFISHRMSGYPGTVSADNIYISNAENPDFGYIEVSLRNRVASRKTAIDPAVDFHHFKLTDLAYRAYFSQRFSFNEIIASSRFKLVRVPNEYKLDVLKIVNNVL
jgi:L-ascorbate metabolism protein UlaG (beta-lactamase superfamily)